ncbi:MAG TPA: ABC transporter permease [Bryobacteraceae bacterium]|nr:ABC transporter permease [Bryobacteraceae bacterium]HOQ45476.1 ABC transporter permease [Bryobacteraceae bacterium]HPQ15687.1 ABC transporter permease [Bryobacteraceae bacterium]HPU73684.1 ABC transporter permease [Bryobacteraceae bacterium]
MHGTASFGEAIRVAMASLRSSKLRSFLTLLGIILATTTLIAVMSVINGMNVVIATQVSDMGADGFWVRQYSMMGQISPKKWQEMMRRNPPLKREEYEFLKEHLTLVRELGMEASRSVTVRYGNEAVDWVSLSGVTPNTAVIKNVQAASGRFFTDSENRRRMYVAYIGNDFKEKFFPEVDPVGKTLQIDGLPFTIVGVAKAQGTLFGQSRDNFIMIPIETFFKIYGSRSGLGYNALAIDQEHFLQAQEEMRMLLRVYRHLRPNEEDNFGIFGADSLVQIWQQLTSVIAAAAVAVVSVFMVVGGVVIMNIMLAVVTERTHEIGIRKSVGARKQDILSQFLVESSTLAAAGGIMGVLLAWVIAVVVRNTAGVPMELPVSAVIVGVGLSTVIGLFFGIYPAKRAAELDPIEALRSEK